MSIFGPLPLKFERRSIGKKTTIGKTQIQINKDMNAFEKYRKKTQERHSSRRKNTNKQTVNFEWIFSCGFYVMLIPKKNIPMFFYK